MIYLSTTRPCVASGDPSYRWDTPEDVVPVDDATAAELLALVDAGFYEVPAPSQEDPADQPPASPSPSDPPRRATRGKRVAEAPSVEVPATDAPAVTEA